MKNHQKLTLLFWHRNEELAIGKKVHLKNWDVENKKAKGGSLEKATNQKINEISVDLSRKFIVLQAEYERITPLMLKNVYRGLPVMLVKGAPKPKPQLCLHCYRFQTCTSLTLVRW
jgi:hypothetical protein